MIDRRQFALIAGPLALACLGIALPGCGENSASNGEATPTPESTVDESGSPPDAKVKPGKKK